MKVEWTSLALRDKDDIFLYIAADNIDAAFRVDALFDEAAGRLAEFPYLGHPGDQPGTREILPHRSYRLVYEIRGGTLFVLNLTHTARLWPPVP
ncbi:type II toxin-antitoxin system RelE/ParE family toxin [Inquilinus sp.]|jgi:toxin ParE1/3/4|uniref:type II toxin-antitoxin system RelE/ParE family toxin n=1 Tax=Inquilinus sp. TaxID=1932117 RepID=UPI0037844453